MHALLAFKRLILKNLLRRKQMFFHDITHRFKRIEQDAQLGPHLEAGFPVSEIIYLLSSVQLRPNMDDCSDRQ